MIKFYSLLAIVFLCVSVLRAQNFQDVVTMTNGNIIHGQVLEMVPNKTIKIQTNGGDVIVLNMTDIEKITKESINNSTVNNQNFSNNNSNDKENSSSDSWLMGHKIGDEYQGGIVFFTFFNPMNKIL